MTKFFKNILNVILQYTKKKYEIKLNKNKTEKIIIF
jgi:hypothetical protein